MLQEILKVKIDFKALEEWKDAEREDIPVASFISLYRALGIEDALESYVKEHPDFQVIPITNIVCNLNTHKYLKKFIEKNWQVYSIDIDRDFHVFWDTSKYPKGTKHYPRKMKALARNAVAMDFANYAPGIDDDLKDNVIVFGIPVEDPEIELKEGK